MIKRGNGLYGVNCRACHGADLRGGDQGGPNLLRSQLVLNDQDGELILPVVQQGRQNPGMPVMPPLNIPPDDVKAIADVHPQRGGQRARTGRAARRPAGRAEHRRRRRRRPARRTSRRSARRATRRPTCRASRRACPDPMALQNYWVGGGGGRGGRGGAPRRRRSRRSVVDASRPESRRPAGPPRRLHRRRRRWPTARRARSAATATCPKVEVNDPREAHRKLLPTYTDKDIHDVTAYLVTLK